MYFPIRSVKPAVFDLFLAVVIGAYLGVVYLLSLVSSILVGWYFVGEAVFVKNRIKFYY